MNLHNDICVFCELWRAKNSFKSNILFVLLSFSYFLLLRQNAPDGRLFSVFFLLHNHHSPSSTQFQSREFFVYRKTKQKTIVFFIVYKYDQNSSLVHACFASNSLIACQQEMKCKKIFPLSKRIGHKRGACQALVELLLFQFENIT